MGARGLSLSLSLSLSLWCDDCLYEFADGFDVWVFSGRCHHWVGNSMQGLGTSLL